LLRADILKGWQEAYPATVALVVATTSKEMFLVIAASEVAMISRGTSQATAASEVEMISKEMFLVTAASEVAMISRGTSQAIAASEVVLTSRWMSLSNPAFRQSRRHSDHRHVT